MEPLLISDYLLGNSFHKKYQDTFIEQAPSFIHDLNHFDFIRQMDGQYKFSENSELTEMFIRISAQDPAAGIFFICFQKYLKDDCSSNLIIMGREHFNVLNYANAQWILIGMNFKGFKT